MNVTDRIENLKLIEKRICTIYIDKGITPPKKLTIRELVLASHFLDNAINENTDILVKANYDLAEQANILSVELEKLKRQKFNDHQNQILNNLWQALWLKPIAFMMPFILIFALGCFAGRSVFPTTCDQQPDRMVKQR